MTPRSTRTLIYRDDLGCVELHLGNANALQNVPHTRCNLPRKCVTSTDWRENLRDGAPKIVSGSTAYFDEASATTDH